VAADWADRPVNYVSFWDAARFANWLHNGQPTGPQGPGTTEDGAYHHVGDQALFGRNPGATFFIPTDDEWYKAAYHDKNAGVAARYSTYATGAFSVPPGNDINKTTRPGNNANYTGLLGTPAIGAPYYRTVVGEFELSDSFYGTFDQSGNVSEWVEYADGPYLRRLRGGGYTTPYLDFYPYISDAGSPTDERLVWGFRVASVPEPSTLVLGAMAVFGMLFTRRMRNY
jgi:formylglycine-generating enzyme required for sulfatase activity